MDDFFYSTSRKRKITRAFFHESLLEGATHFMEEENDQDIINNVAQVVPTYPKWPQMNFPDQLIH